MSLKVVMQDADGERVNDLSRPLHTGDKLALVVETSEPRFLYFVNLAPDGSSHLVARTGRRTPEHLALRVPETGWLTLAGKSGVELVAVVATREPLPRTALGNRALFDLVEQSDERTDLVKLQSPRPPGFTEGGFATMGVRARTLALHGNRIRVDTSEDDTVVLIDIDHRPR